VVVEAKSSRHPLSERQIRSLAKKQQETVSYFRQSVPFLVVSKSGFTKGAISLASAFPLLRIVSWAEPADDQVLRDALMEAFSSKA
jgi:hypothetical protein